MLMAEKQTSSCSSARGTVLQRGKACIRCRRRKMKCDGMRPVCTPCIEADRTIDCEYTDNQGITRTQTLEENVARLELRLQELEHGSSSNQTMLLHDPYAAARQFGQEPTLPLIEPARDAWWDNPEPPIHISVLLVSTFLPHSRALGFEVDAQQFRNHAGISTSHPDRPHPALLNAVYLWAIRVSNSIEFRQHESIYLQRAILALYVQPEVEHQHIARRRVHAIQAEVLLAHYSLCRGHYLEGRYHANAAASLALGCYLHQIAPLGFESGTAIPHFNSLGLPAPRDANERAERIRVFWSVFNLNSCWSAALEDSCPLSDDPARGIQIDTPWSDEPVTSNTGRTVRRFLSGFPALGGDGSYLVLRSRASALYGRAAHLNARIDPATSIEEEIRAVARVTAEFAQELPPLDELDAAGDYIRLSMAVTHAIVHASMVYLYRALSPSATPSDSGLSHANEIGAILEFVSVILQRNGVVQSVVLDPILAVCGSLAGRIFISELEQSSHKHEPVSRRREILLRLGILLNALRRCAGFAVAFPIFAQHASLIEEAMSLDALQELRDLITDVIQ